MDTRHALAVVLLLGAGPALSARQPPTTDQTVAPVDPVQGPTYRTGTDAVSVDVSVLDRQGQPIRGLAVADFTVTVGGQPRRVISAEYVDAVAPPAGAARLDAPPVSSNEGPAAGRMIVFVVDQSTLDSGHARQVAMAAARFVDRLSFSDRSALVLVPVGRNIGFTWNHARVRDGLQRVVGLSSITPDWQYGSLAEARDIAQRNPIALRNVQERECRGSSFASSGIGSGPTVPGSGGTQGPGESGSPGTGGGAPAEGGTGSTGSTSGGAVITRGTGSRGGSGGAGGFGNDNCTRDIQMQADMVWREAQMNSFASLTALRQALSVLGHVRGDKTIVLISGGLPLDDREHTSVLGLVAQEAAAARASLFTVFVPGSPMSVTRRTMSTSPIMDQQVQMWPLETLAGMTGGASFRADVNADGIFDRLGRELSGYYRLGVEKMPADIDGKARRMKVQVSRGATTVRAREIFDVPAYEDRDWTARLADALVSPVPATGVGLRVTSYLAAEPQDPSRLKLLLAGEASRLRPGRVTFQVVVRDIEGSEVVSGEHPLGEVTGETLTFSTSVPVAPGTYVVRLAVMDSGGQVGSVDHRVEARREPLGALSASGPMLVRVPGRPQGEPRLTLDGVRQDERLALQVDLEGENSQLTASGVVFEIAESADGPALVTSPAQVAPGSNDRVLVAQALADVRVLPPGQYVARARVSSGGSRLGELTRAFRITEAPRLLPDAAAEVTAVRSRLAPAPLAARAAGSVQPFALDQVLAPTVVGAFLDRVALRPDAASPEVRELLDRARGDSIRNLVVPDALATQAPVAAAFLKGLMLLAQGKLDPAANAFRSAMRASSDFYPAMVYLGACYAARGLDKEAAGAWNTALIKERDALAVHLLLADALLRSGRGELALQALDRARARWPDNDELKRRFAVAAVVGGRYADGLRTIDELVARRADDEPILALALQVLYEAFRTGTPVDGVEQDRARMARLADVYRERGGPSLALVETWMSAANRRP